MVNKLSQFLAIIFTALALLPGGAHLMALPAKIAMPEHPYFVVAADLSRLGVGGRGDLPRDLREFPGGTAHAR